MVNKVVLVPAYFAPLYEEKEVKKLTGRKKKVLGLLEVNEKYKTTETVHVGYSDSIVDDERLTDDLNKVVESLNKDGYELVSVVPITSGIYDYKCELKSGGEGYKSFGGYGYGYGYSFTSSLIVTAKKRLELVTSES